MRRGVFTGVSGERQRWAPGVFQARHAHAYAYAAVVLSGGYEECGSNGRFRVGPGDVLVHGLFESHLDRFARSGADILNVVMPHDMLPRFTFARLSDPDLIVRRAESDPHEAALRLCADLTRAQAGAFDWPDALAADLLDGSVHSLGEWAISQDIALETLSRGFRKVFGVSPSRFRAEARTRDALLRILEDRGAPFVDVAADAGFADQAHMSRAVRQLTGAPPGHWRRRSNPFKTGPAGSH